MLDLPSIRSQFPFLTPASGTSPIYLDNAATTQKPEAVMQAMTAFMSSGAGNVHRGQHRETEMATDAYEAARSTVQQFINAQGSDEIIFTKNCTEGINLVMRSWALSSLQPGDCIALSTAEHHANIVPWLQLQEAGLDIKLIWIDVLPNGSLDVEQLEHALSTQPVKLVALTGQSNVLGTQTDLVTIAGITHEAGARLLVDAAQLVAHAQIDVQAIGCDFLAFSGHKIYGPTGIGVLYANRSTQQEMTPFMGGGGMVQEVTRDGFTPADAPHCFEAGTPPITEAIGLAAAIEWQKQCDWADRTAHDQQLMKIAIEELNKIAGLTILGGSDASTKHGCLSFTIDGVHPHDLTDILGKEGIALRAGHHCAQPLHDALNIPASTRLSTALYTMEEEILLAARAIEETIARLR